MMLRPYQKINFCLSALNVPLIVNKDGQDQPLLACSVHVKVVNSY